MIVYFYNDKTLDESVVRQATKILKQAGVDILGHTSHGSEQSMDKVDALVFLGASLDARASYLVASCLAQGKEVLCLVPKGKKIDDTLGSLQADEILGKKLHLEVFADDLSQPIVGFLKLLDKDSVRDLFNIKYTLRVSRRIADYLNWKSEKVSMKKADWLRAQIQQIIDNDQDFKDYKAKKFEIKE